MFESRLVVLGIGLSLAAIGSVGCSSTAPEDGSTATAGDGKQTGAAAGDAVANARANVSSVPAQGANPTKALPARALTEGTQAEADVEAPIAEPVQLAPVAPEVIAKQNEYLKKWEKLRPSVAGLPPEEQERQRAALKNATLGN